MAYTETFASVAGAGSHDGSTAGNAWTLAEAFTNATSVTTATRVNIISGDYSSGADVIDGVGTIVQLLCFRGYNSTIGDLENTGWNADGTLDTTGFPVITLTDTLSHGGNIQKYLLYQNLVFTGSINGLLLGDTGGDRVWMIECKLTNTANNSAAACIRFDNDCGLINCDLECSGAAHAFVFECDGTGFLIGCRFKGVEDGQGLARMSGGSSIVGNLFQGSSGGNGIGFVIESTTLSTSFINNTFYNLDTAVTYPNAAMNIPGVFVNNHVTDCLEYINSLYSGTANTIMIEVNNRTRDNTTPRTGIGDGANVGEVTTDTGGASTDYTNAGSNDFTLIDGAPGVEAGIRQYTDIGAYQRAAGAGGGLLVHSGTEGGMNG